MSGAVALVARKNKIVFFDAVGKSDIEKIRICKRMLFSELHLNPKESLVL